MALFSNPILQRLLVTGGFPQPVNPTGFHNVLPATATSGTDTTPANGTQFVTSVFVHGNITIKGAAFLIGSVGGTDKVYAVLYDAAGVVLANSSLTSGGATVGTAANLQSLDFTSTYFAKGPAQYYVGISINGNTSRLRTIAAFCGGSLRAGSVSQTHGTVAAITVPTSFTADKAPFISLYGS